VNKDRTWKGSVVKHVEILSFRTSVIEGNYIIIDEITAITCNKPPTSEVSQVRARSYEPLTIIILAAVPCH
jgi:hypothetical protein